MAEALHDIDTAFLEAELGRRRALEEKAHQELAYKEYHARMERYDAEDAAFAATLGLTWEQFEKIRDYIDKRNEDRSNEW